VFSIVLMLSLPAGIFGDGIINQPVLLRPVETPVTSGHKDYHVIHAIQVTL